MGKIKLDFAVLNQIPPPCETHNCASFDVCAKEMLACEGFFAYVNHSNGIAKSKKPKGVEETKGVEVETQRLFKPSTPSRKTYIKCFALKETLDDVDLFLKEKYFFSRKEVLGKVRSVAVIRKEKQIREDIYRHIKKLLSVGFSIPYMQVLVEGATLKEVAYYVGEVQKEMSFSKQIKKMKGQYTKRLKKIKAHLLEREKQIKKKYQRKAIRIAEENQIILSKLEEKLGKIDAKRKPQLAKTTKKNIRNALAALKSKLANNEANRNFELKFVLQATKDKVKEEDHKYQSYLTITKRGFIGGDQQWEMLIQ